MAILRSVLLSLLMGVGCSAFFETMLKRREWKWRQIAYTDALAVAAGFLVIAVSAIPPYVLQPVRVIAVYFVVQLIYYQGSAARRLFFSVLLCGIYWLLSEILSALVLILPVPLTAGTARAVETLTVCAHLSLLLTFYYYCRKRARRPYGIRLERYGYFPVAVMIAIMAVSMMPWDGTSAGGQLRLVLIFGIAVISVCGFYFIISMLRKEEELARVTLLQEQAQGQMRLYRNMQKNYEQQRRYLHDYKNQLNCIQGMLGEGQNEEVRAYIAGLTGSLRRHADYVDTGHAVVNVVLNQKYQEAAEQGIAMVLTLGNLSGLRMREEDLVTLLVNLLDNAIEACGRLKNNNNKMIWFKMVEENGQLVLAVRNPVEETVVIQGKTIPSSKREGGRHGIGLQNVDEVVRRNGGTSALVCEKGYFCFSAIFEAAEEAPIFA